VFGLPELFLPQGVPQTSTDLELLSVVRTAVRHCIGSLYEPTIHLTGSDYCLIARGGQAVIVGLIGIALFPV
jgi:hypothetical protein